MQRFSRQNSGGEALGRWGLGAAKPALKVAQKTAFWQLGMPVHAQFRLMRQEGVYA